MVGSAAAAGGLLLSEKYAAFRRPRVRRGHCVVVCGSGFEIVMNCAAKSVPFSNGASTSGNNKSGMEFRL